MRKVELKRGTPTIIFLFIFLLVADYFILSSNPGKDYKVYMESGEQLYRAGEYEKAADEFLKAVPLIKETKTLAVLYRLLSLVYYKMGDKNRCEESLRQMFEHNPRQKINSEEHEPDFGMIYNKVRAEYWYGLRTVSEEEEETEQKIIEKLAQKPKKKKNKLIRIIAIVGVAVMLGVATAIILGTSDKNKDPHIATKGKVMVLNRTDIVVRFNFADIGADLMPMQSKTYTLDQGVYTINFFDDTHSQSRTFEVFPRHETRVTFVGWEETMPDTNF